MRKSRRTNAIHEVNAGFAATGPELAAGAGSSSSPPLCCPAKRSAAHVEDNNERQVDGGNDEVTDIPAIGAMAHRTPACRHFPLDQLILSPLFRHACLTVQVLQRLLAWMARS